MAILEKDLQTPEMEPRQVKSKDFAFFMPGLIDCTDMAVCRNEIVEFAGLVHKFYQAKDPLQESMQLGLDESLAKLEQTIETTENGTLVLATKSVIGNERSRQALTDAFSGSTDEDGRITYVIPTDQITAVRALPYPASEGFPEPALILRIKTGIEQPTQYFSGPGTVAEQESPGSWFQFRIADISVGLLTPIETA